MSRVLGEHCGVSAAAPLQQVRDVAVGSARMVGRSVSDGVFARYADKERGKRMSHTYRDAATNVTLARPNPFRTIVTRGAVWQPNSDARSASRIYEPSCRRSVSRSALGLQSLGAGFRSVSPPTTAAPTQHVGVGRILSGGSSVAQRRSTSLPLSSTMIAVDHFWERLTAEHILKVVSELPPRDVIAFVSRTCLQPHSGMTLRCDERNDVLNFLRKHFGLRNAVASSKEPLVTSSLVGHGRLPPSVSWSVPVRRFVNALQREAQTLFYSAIEDCISSIAGDLTTLRRVTEAVLERVWMPWEDARQIAEELLRRAAR
jgi:hypothetical protein